MKRVAMGLILVGLCLLLTLSVSPVGADETLPHGFYGTVEVNGAPASVGSQVSATGAGVVTGIAGNPIAVAVAGQYGGAGLALKLTVQGSIASGTPIEFYVDGVRAQCATPGGAWGNTYPWAEGAVTELNLRVLGPTSTPTSTATSTPTNTPTPTSTPTNTPTNTSTFTPFGTIFILFDIFAHKSPQKFKDVSQAHRKS